LEFAGLVGGDVSVGFPGAAAVFYGDVGHGSGQDGGGAKEGWG
jgi:hypothetical protein